MIDLLITQRLWLFISMVSGLLNQLQHVLTIVFDEIARASIGSGANWAVVIDTSKAFARVYCAGLPHKHSSNRISGKIFGLTSSFLNNKWLQVVPDGMFFKNIQLMLEFFQAPFLILHFFCFTLMTFLVMLSVMFL